MARIEVSTEERHHFFTTEFMEKVAACSASRIIHLAERETDR